MRLRATSLLLIAACGSEPAPTDDDVVVDGATCDTPVERTGVVTSFALSEPDEHGRLDGFDLDGVGTTAGDGTGCGVPDDIDPRGRLGVDAALNHLIHSPALQGTEIVGLTDVLQTAVNQGDLLVLFRLSALDDVVTDDCVGLEVVRASGKPAIDATGRLVSDQTFEPNAAIPTLSVGDFPVVDGAIEAGPFDFPFPVAILGFPIEVTLRETQVRLTLAADGTFHGVMAGAVDVAEVIEVAETGNINEVVGQLLRGAMDAWADLDADGDGACERISFQIALEGVPAFVFESPVTDTGDDR